MKELGENEMSKGRKKKERTVAGRQRKKNKRKYLLYYISAFVLLTAAGISLSLTVFFNIENVRVEGETRYNPRDLIESFGVKIGDNLIRTTQKLDKKDLDKKYPFIASIKFKRVFPSELIIEVIEEKPEISLESEGRTAIISQDSKVLEITSCENVYGFPRVCGVNTENLMPGEYLATEMQEKVAVVDNLQNLLGEVGVIPNIIDIRNISEIHVLYDGRVDILLGGTFEHEYKVNFIRTALNKSVNESFCGLLDVSQRPTARLRPFDIFWRKIGASLCIF